MKYTYATLLLDETDAEINERNLTAVLEAAGADVTTSRVKAMVAALEGVDPQEYTAEARSGGADADPPPLRERGGDPDDAGDGSEIETETGPTEGDAGTESETEAETEADAEAEPSDRPPGEP